MYALNVDISMLVYVTLSILCLPIHKPLIGSYQVFTWNTI